MRTIQGLMMLLGMLARSRFRLRGRYWAWRETTATGTDDPPRTERLRATLEYARWLERMRRISR